MRRRTRGGWIAATALASLLATPCAARGGSPGARLAYPATRTVDTKDVLHGVTVPDPYRWLEDARDPEVRRWMKEQDDLARRELARLPGREKLRARLEELAAVDSVSLPVRRGRFTFVEKGHAGKGSPVVAWREGRSGEERVLLDPAAWSRDGSLTLGAWEPTGDGTKVAYQVRAAGSAAATLRVVDVASGMVSGVDVVEGAGDPSPSWAPDGSGFYYTRRGAGAGGRPDERAGPQEIRFHRLGASAAKDRVVHEGTVDPAAVLAARISRDGRWLVVSVHHGGASTDVFFRDLADPKQAGRFTPLVVGTEARWSVEAFRDRFYVTTDDGAPAGRVFEVDPSRPARRAWREVVPERPDATIARVAVLGGRLAVNYQRNASSLLEVRSLDGSLVREVKLPGPGKVEGPVGLPDEDEAFFSFESYTTPPELYATSMRTGRLELGARPKLPVDPSRFTVEEASFPSKDGTRVSLFLVRSKDLARDGKARCILTGYGGFRVSEAPSFSPLLFPWLEAGGVWAVAHVRGGGEHGEAWHRDGMLLKKQNSFDDFLAAARWLSAEKVTSPDRLAISGGSNGGLLVGAALTQAPALFSAVLCEVPLLDMIRYHLSGWGRTWVGEYGSVDDPQQFAALRAYSPYHALKKGTAYPATLILSVDGEDRVDPMHARKFAAALQAATTGGPVLLRLGRVAGHGSVDGLHETVEARADEYAFVLAHTRGD